MRQNALNKISFNKLIRPKNTMIQKRIQKDTMVKKEPTIIEIISKI
jgi:hypothetical protein